MPLPQPQGTSMTSREVKDAETDALTLAVGRILRSQAKAAELQTDHLRLLIAHIEERLEAALDRIDELEALAESHSNGSVLRHVDHRGRVKMITP